MSRYVTETSAVSEHCQATGHNINSHNVNVLSEENYTIKRRIKEAAIAIKQRIGTKVWTSRPYTILSWEYVTFLLRNLTFCMADEVPQMKFERFERNIRFCLSSCAEFWNLYTR